MVTVPIFEEPVISSVNLPWHVDRINHIWRISNLHCKTFMAWLMAQSYFVSPIHCIAFNNVFMCFMVCGECNAILLIFSSFLPVIFIVHVYYTDLSLVWGLPHK